jgi:acid phosphatase type 7
MTHTLRPLLRALLCALVATVALYSSRLPGLHAYAQQTAESTESLGVFLTWKDDPTSSIVIDWQTAAADAREAVTWRKVDSDHWFTTDAGPVHFPGSERHAYRASLENLEPATTYEFRAGSAGRVYRFRTMPREMDRDILFAAGGDTRHTQEMMEKTARQAVLHDLDFIIIGGDLAYADGNPANVNRWHEWFDAYQTLIREDGRVIPMVASIGNHETSTAYFHRATDFENSDAWRERVAPFFFNLFAFPGHPGYGALDFGNYLTLLALDTDHVTPIDGAQRSWLEERLEQRSDVRHIFPFYHVPAYPSVRRFDGSVSTRVRQHWVPLFEQHNIRLVFESHDHAYKRTHPIRSGVVAENGIVYMGDGAWGVGVREIGREHDEPAWYLAQAASVRHFILVRLEGDAIHAETIDEDGNVIDRWAAGL